MFKPCNLKIQMDECNCKDKNAMPKIESRFYRSMQSIEPLLWLHA
uniref:Amidophosphoribosyltransferase n=1 Tax=Arundo donax TaxID=35708 RepID=A0A0A9G0L5_ARUDO